MNQDQEDQNLPSVGEDAQSSSKENHGSKPNKKAKSAAAVAKGKAKAKAKAKAKGKAKTSSKTKGSNAGKNEDDEDDQDAGKQKKPAAKAKPKAKGKAAAVKDLKKRMMEGISDAFEGDNKPGEDKNSDVRDRCKANKFMQLMSDGMVPQHIVDMFQDSKKGSKKRHHQTQIINNLFTRTEDGRLVMTPTAPMFQAYKDVVEKDSFNDKHTATPKGIFCGQYFGNNEQALMASVRAGEIKMFQKDGLTWCCFNTIEFGHASEKTSTQHLLQVGKKWIRTQLRKCLTHLMASNGISHQLLRK